jgi:predicted metalloprotease
MKLDGREESENVEDRRGMGRGTGLAIAGGGGSILLILLCVVLGVDPRQLMGQQQSGPVSTAPDPAEAQVAHFTKVVFGDTERVWDEQFRKLGLPPYEKPKLVLFSGEVETRCGEATSAVGPFYCPGDSKVYIDLSFYREMEQKLNAGGDFARAYVVAHEVGHHVQRLLGYPEKAANWHPGETKNEQSVRLELQADYLAGVWAHYGDEKYHFLEPGDIKSAINAAFEIGDDRLTKRAGGKVFPEKFTHGTSKQRMKWFEEGYKTGDVKGAEALFRLPYDQL